MIKPDVDVEFAGSNPLNERRMAALGFQRDYTLKDPSGIIHTVKTQVEKLKRVGSIVPIGTAKNIYEKICGDMNTAPINIFKHYKKSELSLTNYTLND